MKHLYKKNKYYYYKRRIPNSNKFFSFNTFRTNYKKAFKIVALFNRLSQDLFEYLKLEGKNLFIDYEEIDNALESYKEKALVEYSVYEEKRHDHIGKIMGITKNIPGVGEKKLNGAHPDVIKPALEFFEYLAFGSYNNNEHRKDMSSNGKDLISRVDIELQSLYRKLNRSKDKQDIFNFLSLLFKKEAEVLQTDLARANCRFGANVKTDNGSSLQTNNTEYKEKNLSLGYKTFKSVAENFLTTNFSDEELTYSKSNGYKVKTIVHFLLDFCKDKYDVVYMNDLKAKYCEEAMSIIRKIPKKRDNGKLKESFYFKYKANPNIEDKDELKGQTTLLEHIKGLWRFLKHLNSNEFLTNIEFSNLDDAKTKEIRIINQKVNDGLLNGKINVEAFKDSMIEAIFDKDKEPYRIVFDKLETIDDNHEKDILIAKFYVPLIMFFSGSRLEEVAHLLISDCEILEIEGRKKLMLYIQANKNRGTKNISSKRKILVHDFLANELNLISFIEKVKTTKREFLFNLGKGEHQKISKEFNRNKEFLEGNLDRDDEFKNARYSLYSFRHHFRTHMESINVSTQIINKIQGHSENEKKIVEGYLSITDELNENINRFTKHQIIDWKDFIALSKKLAV